MAVKLSTPGQPASGPAECEFHDSVGASRGIVGSALLRPGHLESGLTRQTLGADTLRKMAALPGGSGEDRIVGEQAALRRVATLVARAAPPAEVFTAVTEEAGRLLRAEYTTMARYDPDGARTVVAAWSSTGVPFPVGTRTRLGGRNVSTLVFQTRQPARIDDHASASGPAAAALTLYPNFSNKRRVNTRTPSSSSTSRMVSLPPGTSMVVPC